MSLFKKLFHIDKSDDNIEAEISPSVPSDTTACAKGNEAINEEELLFSVYEKVTNETLTQEDRVKFHNMREQNKNPKIPAPGQPGSSKDNPLIVGMTGPDITKQIIFKDGIWYQTDGLGNGVIR